MKDNYQTRYQKVAAKFNHHPVALRALRVSNRMVVWTMYVAYLLILLSVGINDFHQLWKFIVIPGVAFVALSLVRQWINAPRPYEKWAIVPLISREKKGDSMPSRHVFSAALIAMCGLQLNLLLGIFLLLLTLISAITRVIGGVHFPKDVLVGMLAGVACGLLLFL
ncbi:phosphatase PAP2 family protein [Limosilactobacillus caccae]|uniref:phosphatase PAP2 family protein n=1 Tax=Limosilactobacillus caccae TaxID=1926284 RepID=UPI000970CE50|nr:phosphatase PAP2 family protein [Limosilactobacillus caccae]